MKTVYILSRAEIGVTLVSCEEPSKEYEHRTCQIFMDPRVGRQKLPALQVTPWCPPSAYHASTSLRDCENQHLICLEILQTSKCWQTDPYLTLTLKDTDTQAVRCLQNALKFLHHLNYGEKLMMGHSTWAPCTHKTGQAEASRASPTGTQCCSAPYTQHITKEFCSHRSHWCRTEFSATSLSHSKEPLS